MTLKSDMIRTLENDDDDNKVLDVTLVGCDGGRVKANKAILAIRSPVFQRMFFGNFSESSSDEVQVGNNYPSVVLKVIVRYCFADELDLDLLYKDTSEAADEEAPCGLMDEEAVAMVQVRDAANYLELFDLHKTISDELGSSIMAYETEGLENRKMDLACVCAVMQELMVRYGDTKEPFFSICMHLVKAYPEACLLPSNNKMHNQGVLACSMPLLETLFRSPTLSKQCSLVSIKALQKWSQGHHQELGVDHEAAKKLKNIAGSFKLDYIPPAHLATIKPCSLFSMETLYKALVHHALSDEKDPTSSTKASGPQSQGFVFGSYRGFFATVQGAGLECLNGKYDQKGEAFEKRGSYGDVRGAFCLKKRDFVWELSFSPSSPEMFDSPPSSADQEEVSEFSFYQSEGNGNQFPPFALWKCTGGQDPTPYVIVQAKTPKLSPAIPTTPTVGRLGLINFSAN